MMRARLLPGKAKAAENGADASGAAADAKALLDDLTKIVERVGRNPVLVRLWGGHDDGGEAFPRAEALNSLALYKSVLISVRLPPIPRPPNQSLDGAL
jgi:hypothetical protein